MVRRAPQHQEIISENNGKPASALRQMAGDALTQLRGLSAEEQCEAGVYLLGQARQLGDDQTRDFAERALQVMDKFPHYPRPRAAVAMRALESLAQG